jgi:hypothetical protein
MQRKRKTTRDPNNDIDRAWMCDNLDKLHPDETAALLWALLARVEAMADAQIAAMSPVATPTQPEPTATVEAAAAYALPTAKMRQSLARFDDLSDGDQVDVLRQIWGE